MRLKVGRRCGLCWERCCVEPPSPSSCLRRGLQGFLLCTPCAHSGLRCNEAVWSPLAVGDSGGRSSVLRITVAPGGWPWRPAGSAAHVVSGGCTASAPPQPLLRPAGGAALLRVPGSCPSGCSVSHLPFLSLLGHVDGLSGPWAGGELEGQQVALPWGRALRCWCGCCLWGGVCLSEFVRAGLSFPAPTCSFLPFLALRNFALINVKILLLNVKV